MEKVLRTQHRCKTVEEVEDVLAGYLASPHCLVAYAVHSSQKMAEEPNTVIGVWETELSDEGVLLNGSRYVWLNKDMFDELSSRRNERNVETKLNIT